MNNVDSINLDEYTPEEKYVLILLYAPTTNNNAGIAIRGNLWLQKVFFLLTKVIEEVKEVKFDDHNFGPYNPTINAIKNQYKNSHIVKQIFDDGPIKLTENGLSLAKKFWNSSPKETKEIISEVKSLLNGMKRWEVISLIYSSYPETTKNSDVVDKFNDYRVDSAMELFKQKKVSLEKASTISGLPLEDFVKVLKKNDISAYEVEEKSFNEDLSFLERFVGH